MSDSYQTAAREGHGIYEEKKSIFYSYISPIETEEEALEFVELVRCERDNMRHVCYAYINRIGNVVRFSDDGEPSGTAGMPILEVLRREELVGVVCAVARYFGGILLGAGGLIRAYGKAAKLSLDDSGKATFVSYGVFKLSFDYTYLSKIRHEIGLMKIPEEKCEFGEKVSLTLCLNSEEELKLRDKLADITSGRAIIEKISEKFAPLRN
ncbi:MAG: YigZ family protein [Clostridia bacterium]|nr:YigZ family protein [Clostridia bacterium]